MGAALDPEYTWILAFGIIFSFIAAFGIGANDVANAFATSVGAKSITLKQAVIIAAIFEFSGAFFMGSHVASTIRKGITDLDHFEDIPDVLMFGMMCVCFSVSVWLLLATALSLPVSTTHTCVGSVLGVAVAARGFEAVNWDVVTKIVISWFASPILSGLIAVGLWKSIKHGILRGSNPRARTLMFYPFLVSFCVIIVIFYTIFKGSPQYDLDETPLGIAFGIAFGVGIFAGLLTYGIALPYLEERMDKELADKLVAKEEGDEEMAQKGGNIDEADSVDDDPKRNPDRSNEPDEYEADGKKDTTPKQEEKTEPTCMAKIFPDLHKVFEDQVTDDVLKMLSASEAFDESAELAFSYLQVFSACFDAFAHGANDVANAIGPMAAVYAIWDTGIVEKKVDMPLWILAMGGIGLVVGLALYGQNIIIAIGHKLTKISPSRGFCIEIGAALVVITGSRFEIPLSTTHCQVGATVGVGMSEGINNVNWWSFLLIVIGWIITLVVAALVTGLLFSFAVYAPHK